MSDIVRDIEVTPDLDELLQEAPQLATVPVKVDGSVLIQRLPNRYVQSTTFEAVDALAFVKVLEETEKRSVARLISLDGQMIVKAGGLEGCRWPANVPFEVTHTQAVKVRAVTGTTTIGVVQEFWAD